MKKLSKSKRYPKNKQWAVDQDYFKHLSKEEQSWLTKFNDEYYKGHIKKGDNLALHNTDSLRKDCYSRNNQMNRDLYAIGGCTSNLIYDSNDQNNCSLFDNVLTY